MAEVVVPVVSGGHAESVVDPGLPADPAVPDRLLADPARCAPGPGGAGGRGGEPLVREVADALHPRRLCRIALTERVPDDPTVRKPVTRLGPEVIEQIAMAVIAGAITAGANAAVGGAGRED